MKKYYKHKYTGKITFVRSGYNWRAFLFGVAYALYKRQYKLALVYWLVSAFIYLSTFYLLYSTTASYLFVILYWLYIGQVFNEDHELQLIKNDYKIIKKGNTKENTKKNNIKSKKVKKTKVKEIKKRKELK